MKKILVCSFSFIGDAVLSTVVIEPLRSHFSDAHITFLLGPSAVDLLAGDSRLDATCVYDSAGEHGGVRGRLELFRALRCEGYDLVVNLRDSFVARCLGAEHWGLVWGDRERHAVVRYLDVLCRRGVDVVGASPCLQLGAVERSAASRFLVAAGVPSGRRLIGIHPGGNWIYKLWRAERYAALCKALLCERGVAILLFGGPDERELQAAVASGTDPAPILVTTANLREVAALIERCDIYIGNDTGPMHIAAAVGTPVIGLFGSTDHVRSGPYGSEHTVVRSGLDLGCNPCHPGRTPGGCGAGGCAVIDGITVEQVLGVVAGYTSSILQ